MLQEGAFTDQFIIRQLIFVNSAAYAYTEIRVDQHTALFGRNNLGKTSMLNALKLFLLPEENFNGCKKKFGFASSKGDKFEGPESFSYYFPSDNSFIILEAENVHGKFCLVLHQGNKQFSYGRLAVPCEFEKIRSLFWDFTSHENERMGAPNGQLSLKFVVSALKQFGAEQIGDVKTLKERLFSEKALDPKLGRFCLLPLKQGGTVRELEAWRQLIHLAFDISAKDECTLPNAVATIIEGEKQRSAEQVSVDFDQILQAYNDLKQEGDRLQNFQNHLSDWHQFDQTYQQYGNDSKRAAQLYLNLVSSLDVCADKLEKDALDTSKQYDKKKRDFESNRQEYLKVDTDLKKIVGGKKQVLSLQKPLQAQLSRIVKIRAEFHDSFDLNQIVSALQEHYDGLDEEIHSLRDRAKLQQRLEGLIRRINQLEHQEQNLTSLLEGQSQSLLDQLDSHSASVLKHLNENFSRLKVTPSESQLLAIEQFTSLFSRNESVLEMFGQTFSENVFSIFDPDKNRQDLESELNHVQRQRKQAQSELQKLNELDKQPATVLQQTIASKEKELKETRSYIELAKAFPTLNQQAEDYKNRLIEIEAQESDLTARHKQLVQLSDELSKELKAAEKNVQVVKELQAEINKHRVDLGAIKDTHAPVIDQWKQRLQSETMDVTDKSVNLLREQTQNLRELGDSMREGMAKLLRANLLEDDNGAGFLQLNFGQLRSYRDLFDREFSTLDVRSLNYRDRVRSHNKETSIKMDELRGAARQIKTFSAEINQQFKGFKVSNLDQIEVAFSLHPRFEQLLNDLEKVNFHSEELHDARLYNRLNDFCDEFFKKVTSSTPTLRMEQIIQKVSYRYKLEGQEGFDSKEQSNGTSSMVNCLLLSILLKRLLRSDAQICIPLVMDEMGSLDRENLQTAARIAQTKGFVLFGASPDISSEIVQAVKNYVNLGSFKATDSSYSEKRRVIYHTFSERLYEETATRAPDTSEHETLPA
ncbi:hypothetical protein Q8W30_00260 [Neptunomonas phycophila]|uniref:Endonuclease GajA/Old nuclease/RecF-like AAA domain-containing protein n=1 Tax=Neptunomonas phycophila TaxID=1572645 RepID=A0ABT9EPJ2_9GAMM|nr:hypothetical protein [Neptunomonas phycophila]MDP2520985.1 hypothetical protein [Neptunomonas phycophila]